MKPLILAFLLLAAPLVRADYEFTPVLPTVNQQVLVINAPLEQLPDLAPLSRMLNQGWVIQSVSTCTNGTYTQTRFAYWTFVLVRPTPTVVSTNH